MADTLHPVRELLERLGLELAPTLHSTGAYAQVELPEWEAPTLSAADVPVPWEGDERERIGRFLVKHPLGAGGMGAVFAVHDPELARDVALKVVRDQDEGGAARIARFVSEAQITGQLEHPGIVPVHEIGVTPEGALYYTMKRLHGRSLRQLLRALRDGEEDWPLQRRLAVFAQICDAVGFAHSRGVLHRDLKPENLLLGSFGEVLVVDWGLAALMGAENPYEAEPAPNPDGRVWIHPVRRTTTTHTEDGATLGSPGYMAPEQARADRAALGPPADVFALGCVLYELVTLERAYVAENPLNLMFQLMSGPPMAPRERAPGAGISPELEAIVMGALASDPANRPADAAVLGEQVRSWLDGSRRREAARVHLEEARQRWTEYLAVRQDQRELSARERALDAETPPWTPMAEKAELLALRDRLAALGSARLAAFSAFVTACDQARAKDPDHPAAAELLAEGWWTRLQEAEAEGDPGRARWAADRVRELAPRRYAERLEGKGSLTLRTEEPAEVLCQRVVQEGIVWSLGEARSLGTTPLVDVPLGMGSWLLTLRAPGRRDVRYPVFLRRAEHWDGGAPLPLFSDDELGPDWVYVPAGPFLSCGDAGALEARPSTRPVVPGFLVARRPLSLRDWLGFVNGLHPTDPETAWDCVPSAESGVREAGERYWTRPGPGGAYSIPAVDRDGDEWHPDWPVFGISWHHAVRCADWTAEQTGLPVRMPTLLEREKAGRGVDGRVWPWGNRFDSTLARIRTSRPGRPRPEPVGTYASDVSIYGMQDAAGCIRELCGDPDFEGNDMLRPVVSASWNHLPDAARCASRLGTSHWNRSAFMGVRLARDLPR